MMSSAYFFSKTVFLKHSFRNTFIVSNSFDPNQDLHLVGPDLGPNCLQRLSADKESHCWHGNRLTFVYNKFFHLV